MIEIVPYLPNYKLHRLAGLLGRPIRDVPNPCYEKEILEATAVIFECSLRGFHIDARNILLTNDTHFDNLTFFTPSELSSGAKALKAAGVEVDHIFLIHMLAATRKADDLTSYEIGAYRANIRWALKGFPAGKALYPDLAIDEADTVAGCRGNNIVKWEICRHRHSLQSRLGARRPFFTSAVADIGAGSDPQP